MNLRRWGQCLAGGVLCLASAAAMPTAAWATPLTDLFAGSSIGSGTTQFTDWELVAVDSLTLPGPDLSQIDVVPLLDDPLNPGIQFVANGEMSTVGLDNINLVVKFKVSPTVTERIIGHELDLSDVTFGGASGIAFVTSDMADGGDNPVASALVMADKESEFFLTPDASAFAPQAQLDVTWDIFVTGFSAQAPVELNSFTHRFTVVAIPEPAGLAMICMASFVCLAGCRPELRRGGRI